MFYSVVLKRSYPTEKALAHAEHYSARRKALNAAKQADPDLSITERSSEWIGTPTPEDSPPWGEYTPKEATYVKDYELAPLA